MTQPSSSVLFREIHKNAWLKRLPVGEKKALPSNKKAVKVWVVFCVHDDVDPFLEFYLDQEQSTAHKPISSVPLSQTVHVSPTICAHEDEFEFVVTLQSDIVRLTASSWEQMMEWVEAITSKLREMRILSPKENLYSKMPEQRAPLLPTRDPNSPLPLPPLGPSSLLPGVEPVAHPAVSETHHHGGVASVLSPTQVGMIAPSTDSSEYQRGLHRLVSRVSSLQHHDPPLPAPLHIASSSASPSPPSPSSTPTSPTPSSSSVPHTHTPSNITVIEVNASTSNSTGSSFSHPPLPNTSVNSSSSSYAHPLPNTYATSSSRNNGGDIFNFSFVNEALSTSGDENDVFFTPPATPGLPGGIARFINPLSQLSNGTVNDPFAPCTSSTCNSSSTNSCPPPIDPFSPQTNSSDTVAGLNVSRVDPFAPIASSGTSGVKGTANNSSAKLASQVWDFREETPPASGSGGSSGVGLRAQLNSPRVTSQTNGVRKSNNVVTVSSDSRINIVPPSPATATADPAVASSTKLAAPSSVASSSSNVPNKPVFNVVSNPPATSKSSIIPSSNSSNPTSKSSVPSSSNSSSADIALTKPPSSACVSLSKAPPVSSINSPSSSSHSKPVCPSTVVVCKQSANNSNNNVGVKPSQSVTSSSVGVNPAILPSTNHSSAVHCKSTANSSSVNVKSTNSSSSSVPNVGHPSVVLCKSSTQTPQSTKPINSSVNVITCSSSSTPVSSSHNVPVLKTPPVAKSSRFSPPPSSAVVRPISASSVLVGSNVISSSSQSSSNRLNGALGSPKPRRNSTSNDDSSCNDVNLNGHAGNLYEHLFLATDPLPSDNTGNTGQENNCTTPSSTGSQANNSARSRPATRTTVNPQPNRPRKRSTSNSESSGHLPNVPADRIRAVSQRQQSQPSHQPITRHGPISPSTPQSSGDTPLVNPSGLTLREQQVLQLRREMLHPGGVRLQLRRKDCVSSIALVDAFNAVWIAGWKQKEHPMLYNAALHIGDQVLKIMGQFVQNAADAQKLIRSKHGIYVEFVIKRVPRGQVFAMCREHQGQSLGIVQENTAEIKDIVPNSLAYQQLKGITLRTPSMDGLGLTTWWITEINGRPLNLFFKDNEVKDRLNCVGLDISILIQPFDLIKQIRKQMKSSIRGYKDYIVQ